MFVFFLILSSSASPHPCTPDPSYHNAPHSASPRGSFKGVEDQGSYSDDLDLPDIGDLEDDLNDLDSLASLSEEVRSILP